jgi:ribosomal protein S10
MDDTKMPVCIKLDKKTRDNFKRITHNRKITMQKVIKAFIEFYVDDPDSFFIQNNVTLTINKGI